MILEHRLDRLQVKLCSEVHDSQIFFVEVLVLFDGVAVALNEVVEQIDMRVHVTLKIHGHEASKLHEAWVDGAHESGVRKWHGTDDRALKPFQRA